MNNTAVILVSMERQYAWKKREGKKLFFVHQQDLCNVQVILTYLLPINVIFISLHGIAIVVLSDCKTLYEAGYTTSGIHLINPDGGTPFEVSCFTFLFIFYYMSL